MNRREFLGGGLASVLAAPAQAVESKGVRFCVFADIHYNPGVYPNPTKDWLRRILDHAKSENCDFIIQLGDFCHHPTKDGDYIAAFRDCGIPAYHVIGNHDDDANTHEETLRAYGLASGHYFFDRGGFRFVVVDSNYIRWSDGRVEHYSCQNYFKKTDSDRISYVPDEELVWLRQTLEDSPFPCVICSHQSFERPFGSACSNAAAVRAVLDDANRRHPGRVLMAMNGHHHCDNLRVLENILYFDVNSATFQWLGSKFFHDKYPKSYKTANAEACRILGWDDPLHAIVTLRPGGRISIKGMKSRFSHGITPKDVGFGGDACRRLTTPDVQSAEIVLSPIQENNV